MRGDEKRVVDAFCAWLQSGGWDRTREQEFVDVVARRDGVTLYAEGKGRTAAIGLDVDTVYGQILRRMPSGEDSTGRFAVVAPTEACVAALRVRKRVRERLRIEIYCVDEHDVVRLVAE
ncbi:MAG: hypothetical protein H0V94_06210 [Actinobacteria bacterium]|nr:hypothetical protein [Actinomycetota bacterium]